MDSQKNHGANNPVSKTLTLVLITTFLFSTSCTTTRVISSRAIKPQPDTLRNELKKGDLVNVTTKKSSNNYKFRITDITSEAIFKQSSGYKSRRILFTEIAKIEKLIEKKQPYPIGTLLVVAFVVVVLYYAVAIKRGALSYGG